MTKWLPLVILSAAVAVAPTSAGAEGFLNFPFRLKERLDRLTQLLEPKTLFVTSQQYTGDLGGAVGADDKCNALAQTGIVPEGEYVALLFVDGEKPHARATASLGMIIRPDGGIVAENIASLFARDWPSGDEYLISRPLLDENGTEIGGGILGRVWTGANAFGQGGGGFPNCADWMIGDNAETGNQGQASSQTEDWFLVESVSCDQLARLYCLQR
jgi:hypothetical protein